MPRQLFYSLCEKYTGNSKTIDVLWAEIEKTYQHKKRFYHTLTHIENVTLQLNAVKKQVRNWDAVLFAAFYHDIIYDALEKDNEEKSAELAEKRLTELGCSSDVVTSCSAMITATKKHQLESDSDVNYFTDADLSILGAEWTVYKQYAEDIRKEYAVFPDSIYKPGRKKVLEHFLTMQQIFKTAAFFDRFEQKAKNNLAKELQLLL